MKKQMVIKNGFYKKYVEDQKPAIQEKMKSEKSKDSMARVIYNVLSAVFRIIGYVVLFGLSSVGLTALINDSLRRVLLEILR